MHRQTTRINRLAVGWFAAGLGYALFLYLWRERYLDPFGGIAWVLYAAMAVCLWALAQTAARRIQVFLLTASVVLPLTLFNAVLEYLHATAGARIQKEMAQAAGGDFDMRSPAEALEALRATDRDAVPALCPSFTGFAFDGGILPLGGWPERLTMLGNENGYYASYVADRYGFNNPDSVYEAASGRPRVVLLGDSFAQGFSVHGGADAASIMRNTGFNVLNLGCASNGPLAQLAGFVEYGSAFGPEVVVFFYLESNDLADLARESDTLLAAYLDPEFSQNLPDRRTEIETYLARALSGWGPKRKRDTLSRLATLAHVRKLLRGTTPANWSDQITLFADVMTELVTRLAADHTDLLVVYLPDGPTLASGTRKSDCRGPASSCKQGILEILANLDIRVLDFGETLSRRGDETSVFSHVQHGHFTEAGYALLGVTIASELRAMGH